MPSRKPKVARRNNRGTRSTPSRKAKPQFLTLDDGSNVWITTATLADVKTAAKLGRHPYCAKSRQYLVTAPAHVRSYVYERAQKAMEAMEARLLPPYGSRPWKVVVQIKDDGTSPYFTWVDGQLELACWPHWLDRLPTPPRFPGYSTKRGTSCDEEEDGIEEEEDPDAAWIEDMLERPVTALTQLTLEERWRVPLPQVTLKWISPLHQTFSTRKQAWEHAVELCKQEVFLDKTLEGYGADGRPVKWAFPSQRTALKAGKLRFERDGLWVVGQEEAWLKKRMQEELDQWTGVVREPAVPRKLSPLMLYIRETREAHRAKRLEELKDEANTHDMNLVEAYGEEKPVKLGPCEEKKEEEAASVEKPCTQPVSISFTLQDADKELRALWKQMNDQEREKWVEQAKVDEQEVEQVNGVSEAESTDRTSGGCGIGIQVVPGSVEYVQRGSVGSVEVTAVQSGLVRVVTPQKEMMSADVEKPIDNADAFLSHPQASKLKLQSLWRLNEDHVKLCYDAGINHYEQIVETVKARDLFREMRDGFDLLRERGRGRFDMELPAFDTPAFNFLTDTKKAAWMPIVKQILGKDVSLIHKGMFMSLPGAAAQDYHQDGPHLTTQYQRGCHAINVFIPVVDLTMQRGPTEFCIGSHILGHEEYDRDFVETPTVSAGTPVIFDYRLGHKGLANTSDVPRPIVYLTYAASNDGTEFRDSVNFSRKRYHRIGELVDKTPTREERAKKRSKAEHSGAASSCK